MCRAKVAVDRDAGQLVDCSISGPETGELLRLLAVDGCPSNAEFAEGSRP